MSERVLAVPRLVMDESHDTVRRLLGAEYAGFDARNPGLVAHLAGSAALMGEMLHREGFQDQIVDDGQEMAAVHDVIKDGMGATMTGKWTDEYRRWFRGRHTQGGDAWVAANWEQVANPFVAAFGIKNHHTKPPADYYKQHPAVAYKWGLCHALQACDRAEALLTRPYVLEREGVLDANGVLRCVFLSDDPYPLEMVATINDQPINLAAALRPVIERTLEASS